MKENIFILFQGRRMCIILISAFVQGKHEKRIILTVFSSKLHIFHWPNTLDSTFILFLRKFRPPKDKFFPLYFVFNIEFRLRIYNVVFLAYFSFIKYYDLDLLYRFSKDSETVEPLRLCYHIQPYSYCNS